MVAIVHVWIHVFGVAFVVFEGVAEEGFQDELVLMLFVFRVLYFFRKFLTVEAHIGLFFVEEILSGERSLFFQFITQGVKRRRLLLSNFSLGFHMFVHILLVDDVEIIVPSFDGIWLINFREGASFMRVAHVEGIRLFY